MIRIAGIEKESIVDGEGLRYVIFTQGCRHNCYNCHNPLTHDINGGKEVEIDMIIEEIKKNPLLNGVTISGGEPLLQPKEVYTLAKKIKELNLNIWLYSGYYYNEIQKLANKNEYIYKLLKLIDVLVDGPYIEKFKDLTLDYRGSSNQSIIRMK